MSNNLEVALALRIAQTGLENVSDLIRQMRDAGAATEEFEEETASLSQAMQEAGRKRQLIDQFVDLRRSTAESKVAMDEAKAKTRELAIELRNTENPTRQQQKAFEDARKAARDSSEAYQNNRLRLQNLRGTLNEAGLSTRNLNQHQRDLNKQTRELQQQYQDLRRRVEQASNELEQNANSARRAGEASQRMGGEIDRARQQVLAFLGIDIGAQMVTDLARITDGYANLESRIKLAVGAGAAFERGLADVRKTANDTGASLESVGNLYTKLRRSTQALGTTQADVALLTDTITKSFVVSGASAQEADAAITQLAQGFASGVLRGDEFNSVMEQSPRLSQAMSESLGVTIGQLRAMAQEGQLTTDVIVAALKEQAGAIDDEFQAMPDTVGAAVQKLQNEWQIFLGELNKTSGASDLAVEALNGVSANLELIAELAQVAGITIGSAMLLKAVPAVTALTTSTSLAAVAMGLLNKAIPVAVVAFAITQAINLADAYKQLRAATADLEAVNAQLAESQQTLADRYAEISQKTGVAITNMRELEQALADGRIVADELSGSYLSAADHQTLLAERTKETAEAANHATIDADALAESFQSVNDAAAKAKEENKSLASVLDSELPKAVDKGTEGVGGLLIALRNLEQNVEATAGEIDDSLIKTLEKLNDDDLVRFKRTLTDAIEDVGQATVDNGLKVEYLEDVLHDINRIELDRAFEELGLSAGQALGEVTRETERAVQALVTISTQLKDSGKTAEEQSRVMEQALLGAIPKAETLADIERIRDRIEQLEQSGKLGADGIARVTAELAKQKIQIEKSLPGLQSAAEAAKFLGVAGKKSGDSVSAGATKAIKAMKLMATEATKASEQTTEEADQIRDAYANAIDMAETEQDIQEFRKTLNQLSDDGKLSAASFDYLNNKLNEQAEEIRDNAAPAAKTMAERLDAMKISADNAADKTDKAASSINKAGTAAKSTSQDIKGVTQSTGNYTNQLNGFASQLGDYYSGLKNTLRDLVGDEGVAEFERIMSKGTSSSVDMTAGLDALGLAAAKAREEMSGLRSNVASLTDFTGFSSWTADAKLAFNEIIIAADEARQSNEDLEESIEDVGNTATDTSMTVAVMANTDLTPLVNSAEDVEQAMESMSDSAASALSSIQQDLWRLQGDQAAINEANYRARAAELELDLQAARASGNRTAVADLEKALLLLEQYRDMQRESEREAQLEARESAVDQKIDDLGDQHKSELESIDQQRQVEQTRFDRGQIDQQELEWRLSQLDRRATNAEMNYQAMLTQLERERDRVRDPVHSPAPASAPSPTQSNDAVHRTLPAPIPVRPPDNRVVKVVDVRLGNRTVQVSEGQEDTLLDMLEDAALRGVG